MKHLIYILIIMANLNSCKAQKNTKIKQEITIPKITNEFEKFDISYYDRNKNNNEIRLLLIDKLTILMDYSNGYSKALYPLNSYFSITKNYYKNGNIEVKGVSFNNGSEYGIWYEFDENGTLMKALNTDKGYDFDWRAVIAYCEGNKIPLTKGFKEFDGFQTRIFKNEIDDKKVWEITYQVSGDELSKITLDAKTGKELEKEKLEFINH